MQRMYNCDSTLHPDLFAGCDMLFLDPPFDEWNRVLPYPYKTAVCFTNWNNRQHIHNLYGFPRTELIWNFNDGRWVSHNLPRITHETILIYGQTGDVYVGDDTSDLAPVNKGHGAIGRDKMPERIYIPRDRRALNSVLEYPRNVGGDPLGCWGKPVALLEVLLDWLKPTKVGDPYMGGASMAIACHNRKIEYVGSEIDPDTYAKAVARYERHTRQQAFDF